MRCAYSTGKGPAFQLENWSFTPSKAIVFSLPPHLYWVSDPRISCSVSSRDVSSRVKATRA
jgi:hypothetical protein